MVDIERDDIEEILEQHLSISRETADGETYWTLDGTAKAADAILTRLGYGWLPIASAPKTGELVDLWVMGYRVADARYSVTRDCWLTPHDTMVIGVPTHFMFRPSAPKEGA